MRWWVKARGAHSTLVVGFLAFLFLVTGIREGSAVLPSFIGGTDPVPLMLFVPLPLIVGLVMCLESRLATAEVSGVRRVELFDAALSLSVIAVALLSSWFVSAFTASPHAAAAGRNTAFLAGVTLLARSLFGQPAVMVPVAWLMIVVLFGFETGHRPRAWTVVPESVNSVHAAVASAAACVIGVAAQIISSRKTP
ncbi:hypothetical protein [Streptomyces sp. STR69]|uniref:hypothetical protein n=1 Tax=Streptomyces sp. STR69 TaxID=1796942 RepID=UPI0021C92F85|nr:hypothetical protein [Streptomyces sp. STR69]